MEHVMNTVSKFFLAALVCAAMVAGSLLANADLGHAARTARSVNSAAVMVALNPQPLPPYTGGDEDDYFRG
jgi:hypothetical protein